MKNIKLENFFHKEDGPLFYIDGIVLPFWLNGQGYNNVNDWLIDHPNKEIEFQVMMRLKYS